MKIKSKKSEQSNKSEKPKKLELEKIERISVIFAAILGAIVFIWQIYSSSIEQKEQIKAQLFCEYTPHQDNINLSLEIVNLGQNPLYIRKAYIAFPISKAHITVATVIVTTFEENYSQTEAIPPGASKEFNQQVSFKDFSGWWKGGGKLILRIESPRRSLLKVDITKSLKEFEADYERDRLNDSLGWSRDFCSP